MLQGTSLGLPPRCPLVAPLRREVGCDRLPVSLKTSCKSSSIKVTVKASFLLCLSLVKFVFLNIISFSFTSLLKEEKVAADVVDKISQSSESKSDSNDQSCSPGPDSDHDYTVIGSNSPTHTEER